MTVYVDRNAQAGGYERQLRPGRIPNKCRVTLGVDILTPPDSGIPSWLDTEGDDVKVIFYAEHDLKLPATHGQRVGARGSLVEWDSPSVLDETSEWTIRDYDQDLIDKFTRWHWYSQELRAFVNGSFWLRCRIKAINLMGPNKKDMRLVLTNRQLGVYPPTIACDVWEETAVDSTYNNPFLVGGVFLYGDVNLAWGS